VTDYDVHIAAQTALVERAERAAASAKRDALRALAFAIVGIVMSVLAVVLRLMS
jgi:hypothetical protein